MEKVYLNIWMRENMVNKIKNGIVWVRTPKCATSTLAVHLQNFCEDSNIKFTGSTEHDTMAPNKYVNLGHLWSGNINWDVVKKENRLVIGSVRNPFHRFLSHYKHYVFRERRFQDYTKDISSFYLENYHNTHFEDKFRGMDNYLCKYLGVGDDDGWDKDLVKERYDFFFVSDQLEEGLSKFEKIIDYTFEDKDYKTNTTTQKLKITPEFFRLFEERNKNDFELYNYIQYEYGYR